MLVGQYFMLRRGAGRPQTNVDQQLMSGREKKYVPPLQLFSSGCILKSLRHTPQMPGAHFLHRGVGLGGETRLPRSVARGGDVDYPP